MRRYYNKSTSMKCAEFTSCPGPGCGPSAQSAASKDLSSNGRHVIGPLAVFADAEFNLEDRVIKPEPHECVSVTALATSGIVLNGHRRS